MNRRTHALITIMLAVMLDACGQSPLNGDALCGDDVSPPPDAPPPPPAPIDLGAPWQRHTIYNSLSGADGAALRDVNGDGLLDVTSPWEQSAKTTVSFHPGFANATAPWPTVVLPGTLSSPEDSYFGDVDGDGAIDVITASDAGRRVYVSFAPIDPAKLLTPSAWTTITIAASINVQNWLSLAFADLDGDGRSDIVASGRIGGASVGYFTSNSPRDGSSYTWHVVDTVGSGYSVVPLDVDADGDIDLVITDGGQIGTDTTKMGSRWLENRGASLAWVNHMIHVYKGAEQLARYLHAEPGRVIDGSSRDTGPSFLAIRTTTDWLAWTSTQVIPPQLADAGQYKAVAPGDIDGDGVEDLVITMHHADSDPMTGPQDISGVLWLRNNGDGTWARGEISGIEGYHFDNVTLYDVDGDGDLDVVTIEQGYAGVTPLADKLGLVWYANPGVQ